MTGRKETCPLCRKPMVRDHRYRKVELWTCKNHPTPVTIQVPPRKTVTSPSRICARDGCNERFTPEPNNPSQQFHSGACRQADYRRRKRLARVKDA